MGSARGGGGAGGGSDGEKKKPSGDDEVMAQKIENDIANGASAGMLLPTGSFPGIAEPLGRAALSQFQHAVLASGPDITKVAVLDEFHNFVSPAFTKFLAQARSRGGAAVMSTQTIADFHPDYRDQLLANTSLPAAPSIPLRMASPPPRTS